tara:strand:- start:3584 stop:5005 length:1422 start_codon:yes stop_codon:yes gene_type:complete
MIPTGNNYINGSWCSDLGKTVPIHNPADPQQIVGSFHPGSSAIANSAMDSAISTATSWPQYPVKNRKQLLQSLLKGLADNRVHFAKTITLENGKTLAESYTEVDGAIAEGQYQLEFVTAGLVENVGKHSVRHEPLGAVLLITPWNFPLATIIRKMIPALAAGNIVVVKPSEHTPLTAAALFSIIHTLEFPPGAANLVLGDGPLVVPPMLAHVGLRAVSFTGSSETGSILAEQIGSRDIRLQMEMGGSNAVVVLADADLDLAAQGIISNGFACAGQWCTGTSRAIIEASVYELMLEKLQTLTANIQMGDGMDSNTTMGPVISSKRLAAQENIVATAINSGARTICGGKADSKLPGHFFPPTILADVTRSMSVSSEEMFGPVIMAMKARNVDEALDIASDTPYGLAFSIYTNDISLAEQAVENVSTGICHINLPTAYRDPALPLSGWNASGRGIAESGRQARDFYTKPKAIYKAS